MVPPCKSPELQKSCSKYQNRIPCCARSAAKVRFDLERERGKVLWGKADCVDLFELKKEFLNTGCFEFKAVSWCMFPVLKKGDTLKVEHVEAREMKIGDIPAYRSGDKLFAHRVVGKKVIEGKGYIITRPDGNGSVDGPEKGEKIPEDEILGRIKEIRRGRKILSTERRKATSLDNILYSKAKIQARFARFVRGLLSKGLVRIQSSRIYRMIMAKILKKLEGAVNFQIALPRKGPLAIYNYMPLEKTNISALKEYNLFHVRMKGLSCPTSLNQSVACT